MNTGKYDNISLKEYHDFPGWSKTSLDQINRSPAHYLAWKEEREQTPAMIFGAALHCRVLTPALYQDQYAVAPEVDRRTKSGKEEYQKFVESANGKTLLTSTDCAKIEEIAKAISAHPLAASLLSNGEAEQSFFWVDPKTGLECKARPDYLRHDGICVDLKTTANAMPKYFQRSMYDYRYHVQGAFFMDGIFQATKKECSDFVLIAVEKERPYGIMVYRVDDFAIDVGRRAYQDDLETIKDWQENPREYETVYQLSTSPVELLLPAWAE